MPNFFGWSTREGSEKEKSIKMIRPVLTAKVWARVQRLQMCQPRGCGVHSRNVRVRVRIDKTTGDTNRNWIQQKHIYVSRRTMVDLRLDCLNRLYSGLSLCSRLLFIRHRLS